MGYIKSRKHPVRPFTGSALVNPTAATLMAGLTLAAPAAHAQTQQTPRDLGGVTVSADAIDDTGYKADRPANGKFTQKLVDTPQTITVIKEQVIKEQAATTLTEALKNVPGVGAFYVGENGSTSTGDAIYMRGIDSSNSIFVDGIRDLGSISRDMFNIAEVDVTKGPAGTDYGRTAPSGSINLSSKVAQPGDKLSADLGIGSADYQRGTIDWNHELKGVGNGTAIRLNAMYQDAGVAGRDVIKNKHWGVAPSVAFGLNGPTRVYINYLHIEQHDIPDGGVPTVGLPGWTSGSTAVTTLPRVDSSNFYGTKSDHNNVVGNMATVKIEHDLGANTQIRNISRWGRTAQNYLLSSFMSASTAYTTDPSTWTASRLINTRDSVNTILTNQTNLTTKLTTGAVKHDISVGIELTREKETDYGIATSGTVPTTVSLYNPDPNVYLPAYARTGANAVGSTDTYSVYGFDTLHLGEMFALNLSARLDHYHTYYSSATACGGTARGAVTCPTGVATGSPITSVATTKTGSLFNWKVGPVFKPTSNGTIYADYAISQQPPGGSTFALATSTSSANSQNRVDFIPEVAKTAEIGTKWEFVDKRLLLSAALFHTIIKNDVQADADGTYAQIGKKRVEGIELSAVGQITKAWSLTTGYTLQNTRILNGANVTEDGTPVLSYTPKDSFTLWTTYDLPFGLKLGGGAYYADGLKRGTDSAVGTPAYTDSYWTFNGMASYTPRAVKNLSLQLNVYNLFNKSYVSAINKSGYRYTPGVPRSFRLTASLKM